MQSRNRILDDISKLMNNALGVAQGARDEAETALKGWMDRWLADRDLVTREEFEAVRLMAEKARAENAALEARIAALEAAAKPARKSRSTATRTGGTAGKGAGGSAKSRKTGAAKG